MTTIHLLKTTRTEGDNFEHSSVCGEKARILSSDIKHVDCPACLGVKDSPSEAKADTPIDENDRAWRPY